MFFLVLVKKEEYVTVGRDRNTSGRDIIFKTLKYQPINEEGTVIVFEISIESGFKDVFKRDGYIEMSIQARGESEEGKFNKKYSFYLFSKRFHVENQQIILKRQDIYISYIDFDINICKDKYSEIENYSNAKLSYKIGTYKKKSCYIFDVV